MKKILLFTLLTTFFISCEKEEDKPSFILGIWNSNWNTDMSISSNAFDTQGLAPYVKIEGVIPDTGVVNLSFFETDSPSTIIATQNFIAEEGAEYEWKPYRNSFRVIYSPNGNLIGQWVDLNGCVNSNNEQAIFNFRGDGTGFFFSTDCNSTCKDGGVYLYFDWTDNDGSVTLTYTGNNTYCGKETNLPSPNTLNYTLNGNKLEIGGAMWTKN
jgi:hypothetical protein